MVAYFDTSILFNVYVPQATGTANALNLAQSSGPIVMTSFGYTELRSAMRLCAFRREITDNELERSLSRVDQHLKTSLYDWREPNWLRVFERAEQIGDQVSVGTGIRAMDLMHLAVAMEVGASDFFSADHRQCDAAEKLGLMIHQC